MGVGVGVGVAVGVTTAVSVGVGVTVIVSVGAGVFTTSDAHATPPNNAPASAIVAPLITNVFFPIMVDSLVNPVAH